MMKLVSTTPPQTTMANRTTSSRRLRLAAAGVVCCALLLVRCVSSPPEPIPGQSIVACGQHFDVGTRVVLWSEPDGYDAYREGKFFAEEPPDGKRRYGVRSSEPTTLEELQETVHAFVLHYDVCGTSRQCFKVLHDRKRQPLSVHFLLDLDGTIYQTLDLKERAWHATIANDFSVGVEIASPGARGAADHQDFAEWYGHDEHGPFQTFPNWMTETSVRTEGFVARPTRPELVSGVVQGQKLYQYDYTHEQYEALARLCAGLSRALPRIRLRTLRDANDEVVQHKVPDRELRAFEGIIGHHHVQTNKIDPGPAMQWDRLLEQARRIRR